MKLAVRYFTRSGNTKKLAEAVAGAIGSEALDVSVPLSEKTDTLFLCCSYYAFDVDPAVKEFILKNGDKIGKIVCVGTSAMMKSMRRPVARAAKAVNVPVAKEEFHCRGQFAKVHPGRPNEEDLKKAAAFAEKFV